MVRAQLRQLGKGRKRDVVGDVLLDIGGHPLLLPGRKAATTDRLAERSATVYANELVRQRDAERFGVLPVHRARVLDLRLELESGLPEVAIVKEQARLELDLAEPQRGIGERSARIDIEKGYTRQHARSRPCAEFMPGRNEAQLVREIPQGRPGQAFNKRLAVVALPALYNNEQMAGSSESIFQRAVLHGQDPFYGQARPSRGMAPDDLRRRNVDNRARFEIRRQSCRRAIFCDRMCGRRHTRSELIQGRLGGVGHCSISLATTMPVHPQTLLVVAATTTIKTRNLLLSRRVEARPSRSFEALVFARNFGRSREKVAARELRRDQRMPQRNWRKIGTNRSKNGKVIYRRFDVSEQRG